MGIDFLNGGEKKGPVGECECKCKCSACAISLTRFAFRDGNFAAFKVERGDKIGKACELCKATKWLV